MYIPYKGAREIGRRKGCFTLDITYTEIADEDRWHSIYIEIRRAGGTGIQYSFLRASRGREGYARSNTIHFFLRASRGREGCMYMYIPFKGARGIGRRTGCFRTLRGRIEGNREEKRLLYSITLQYIIMRSRNRERYLAYGAWKGGVWGIGRRKGCFQPKSRLYPLFVACPPKSRLFPPFVACSPKSRLFPPSVVCSPKSLFTPTCCHHKCPPVGASGAA